MKTFRWLIVLLLMLVCLCGTAVAANGTYQLGDKMEDFTFTTYDGKTMSLYDVLEEKDAVLINIWATWCGPCRNEFPHMQEAYEQYSDRIEIFALSCESSDDNETLAAFARQLGLTFPMGQDSADLAACFQASAIPTSVMIDRFGTVCFRISGSLPDAASFTRLFDAFVGEGYTQSRLLSGIPAARPDVQPSSAEELAAALNIPGGQLSFTNGAGAYDWPMTVGEKDGRSVVTSSNQGVDDSSALVNTTVSGKAGDALAVTFKVSSNPGLDLMQLTVNGQVVKSFGGEDGWMTYAWAIPADGDYAVTLSYANSPAAAMGEDTLWVDSIALLTGDEASAALAANPVYPTGEVTSIRAVGDTARRVIITDPTGIIASYYNGPFYIIPEETAAFEVTLAPDIDPEAALVLVNFDSSIHVLADCMSDGRYLVSGGSNSVSTTGYCDSSVILYPSATQAPVTMATYFRDEENLNILVELLTVQSDSGEVQGSWAYADDEPAATALPAESSYVVSFVDQHGNPVPGVMCQVCDESTCQVFVSDASGSCEFTLAPYAWEIHTLKAPEGYSADNDVVIAPVEGGELVLTLTKN